MAPEMLCPTRLSHPLRTPYHTSLPLARLTPATLSFLLSSNTLAKSCCQALSFHSLHQNCRDQQGQLHNLCQAFIQIPHSEQIILFNMIAYHNPPYICNPHFRQQIACITFLHTIQFIKKFNAYFYGPSPPVVCKLQKPEFLSLFSY